MDELDLSLSGVDQITEPPSHPIVSNGTIVQFRNAASKLSLREIDDAFGAEEIPLGSVEDSRFQGPRFPER